ncbi:unnamed protein product, partial [Allacma fusca]
MPLFFASTDDIPEEIALVQTYCHYTNSLQDALYATLIRESFDQPQVDAVQAEIDDPGEVSEASGGRRLAAAAFIGEYGPGGKQPTVYNYQAMKAAFIPATTSPEFPVGTHLDFTFSGTTEICRTADGAEVPPINRNCGLINGVASCETKNALPQEIGRYSWCELDFIQYIHELGEEERFTLEDLAATCGGTVSAPMNCLRP